MRIEWVHPSWRDLVIDHLAADPPARERFLSRCSLQGVVLALSVAGGRAGERELPLLVTDADWDVLTGRVYALAPTLDLPDLGVLLASIQLAIGGPERHRSRAEALALAHAVLRRLARGWDQAQDPVPFPALAAWFVLARTLPSDPPPPAPPDLLHTWAELFPAGAPDVTDRESTERFADWLTLAALISERQPRDLARLRFYDARPNIDAFLTRLEHAPDTVHPAASDHVMTALRLIQRLMPELAPRTVYAARWLGDVGGQAPFPDPPPDRTPIAGWRRFDVSRVLQDL